MAIFGEIQYWECRQKYSAKPITLAHDEILTNGVLRFNCETLEKINNHTAVGVDL
jgi:hypothetical protein